MSAPTGHENYYLGKQVTKQQFNDFYWKIIYGQKTRVEVAEELNISVYTLRKWMHMVSKNIDSTGNVNYENLTFIKKGV